jgi:tetratricopeptide (TPR) repeat protein
MHQMQEKLKKYADEYLRLGNECIIQAHDNKAALANYDKALQLYPHHTEVLVRKGVTLHNEQAYELALKCFNEAVRLSPVLFKAVYNRGKTHLAMKHPAEAAADLDQATTLKPTHAKAHQLFGDALHALNKEEEATIHWALAARLREEKGKV